MPSLTHLSKAWEDVWCYVQGNLKMKCTKDMLIAIDSSQCRDETVVNKGEMSQIFDVYTPRKV